MRSGLEHVRGATSDYRRYAAPWQSMMAERARIIGKIGYQLSSIGKACALNKAVFTEPLEGRHRLLCETFMQWAEESVMANNRG